MSTSISSAAAAANVTEKTANVMEILVKQKLPLTQEAILTSEEYRKQLKKVKFLKQKQISKSD